MNINDLTEGLSKKNYCCFLFGHNYMETKKVNTHFSEYECKTCKIQATNDNNGEIITLTAKLKEINETLFYLDLKRKFLAKFYFHNKV